MKNQIELKKARSIEEQVLARDSTELHTDAHREVVINQHIIRGVSIFCSESLKKARHKLPRSAPHGTYSKAGHALPPDTTFPGELQLTAMRSSRSQESSGILQETSDDFGFVLRATGPHLSLNSLSLC